MESTQSSYYSLPAGTLLAGRYEVESLLGQGGFAMTYLARDRQAGTPVAVKEFFWQEGMTRNTAVSLEPSILTGAAQKHLAAAQQAFWQEAELLRSFDAEPCICRCFDCFRENGTAYLVMEYVEGQTLGAYLAQNGPMPAEYLLRLLLPVIDSLNRIHKAGVLHLDISPDNLMLQPDGSLRLLDFGGARQACRLTQSQYSPQGTKAYAPIELCREQSIGPWSDVYSLCATAYEAMTGQRPANAVERFYHDALVPPVQLRPEIGEEIDALLRKGLSLDTSMRYQSMAQLAEAVRSALTQTNMQPPRRKKHHRWLWAGIAAAVVLAAVLCVGLLKKPEPTETILLKPDYRTNDEELVQLEQLLPERLDTMFGADGYQLSHEGDTFVVTAPLSCFEGKSIDDEIEAQLQNLLDGKPLQYEAEIQAQWEDPKTAAYPGQNQCLPKELSGTRVRVRYETSYGALSEVDMTLLSMAAKDRLDVLGIPYAFGYQQEEPEKIVLELPANTISQWMGETLLKDTPIYIFYEDYFPAFYLSPTHFQKAAASVETYEEGLGLKIAVRYDGEITEIFDKTQELIKEGTDTLYLAEDHKYPILQMPLTEPISDNCFVFKSLAAAPETPIGEEHRALLEYMCGLINHTGLPDTLRLQTAQVIDEKGNWLHEKDSSAYFKKSITDDPPPSTSMDIVADMLGRTYGLVTVSNKIEFQGEQLPSLTVYMAFGLGEENLRDYLSFVSRLLAAPEFLNAEGVISLQGNWGLLQEQETTPFSILFMTTDIYERPVVSLSFEGSDLEPYYEFMEQAWAELDLGEAYLKMPWTPPQ